MPLLQDGKVIGLAELVNIHIGDPFTAMEIGQGLRVTLDVTPLVLNLEAPDRVSKLRQCVRDLISKVGADRCTVYTWENDTDSLVRMLDYGAGIWLDAAGPELDIERHPTLNVVLREQRIAMLRSTDDSLEASERGLFGDTGNAALLVLPLVFRASTVGLVQLYDLNPARIFSTREMALARALGNQAAVALENAHLVRDLQRSLDQQAAMQGDLVRAARSRR
jgi:GAF domain-containing protein